MNSVYDTIYEWARKTTTSFSELRLLPREMQETDDDVGDSLIYRLKRWPDLPSQARTAGVLRTLSVMSSRPVNRQWILSTSKLGAAQVDRLLKRLTEEGAVEVIDGSKFPPEDF
ncbi:hypothetical protein [Caenimonas aquaedulcis]|uniref:Uncharacterized protein n=1 Tax=Caenimonas aquaedulcis TaxID=2793270 RepID=A0A931H3P4_9BURK|nr:hypothetical protein [Caenimonas aquaedulcis]MBG9387942.1 hypothetical protein [Caenimonas aquaedulcis]